MTPDQEQELVARLLDDTGARAPSGRENPGDSYLSEAVWAREMAMALRVPQPLAASGGVAESGSFLTIDGGGLPLLITRDDAGVVRALVNACRHRGAPVEAAAGGHGRRAFACPYHGWTYDLAGRLLAAHSKEGFPGVDPAGPGLAMLPVAERHGLLWRLPPDSDLDAFLGPLGPDLAWLGLEGHVAYATFDVAARANWKVIAEGFLDHAHLPHAHGAAVSRAYAGHLVADRLGWHQRLIMGRHDVARWAELPRRRWRLRPSASINYFVAPRAFLIAHPDHVVLVRLIPVRIDRCRAIWTMLVPEAAAGPGWEPHWQKARRSHEMTFAEDVALAEEIQAALTAGAVTRVRFGRDEGALAAFHETLAALAEG